MAPKKTCSRAPHQDDRAWVMLLFYNKSRGFWDGSVYVPDGESRPENTNNVIQDVWRRQVVSNGELVLRPARQRKQSTKAKPCRVKEPAPRVTRRRGRDNVRPDEPAIGFRNEAPLDACVDNAVRAVDSTDGHTDGHTDRHIDGNGKGDGHNYHGNGDGGRRRRVPDRSKPAQLNNAASSHLRDHVPGDQGTVMPNTSTVDEVAEGEPWGELVAPFAPMAMNGPTDDEVQLGHGDELGAVDLTTMVVEEASAVCIGRDAS